MVSCRVQAISSFVMLLFFNTSANWLILLEMLWFEEMDILYNSLREGRKQNSKCIINKQGIWTLWSEMEKTRWALGFRCSIQYAEEMMNGPWQNACSHWLTVGLWKGGLKASLDLKSTWSGQAHCLRLSGNRGRKGHSQVAPLELPFVERTMSYFCL